MPETLLSVRYKRTRVAKIIYTPIISVVGRKQEGNRPQGIPRVPKKSFQNPFKLLAKPDIILLLIANALICALFYGVLASISTLFNQTYGLDATKIGLCFLAMGGGMAIGSSINGKLLDKQYELEKKRFIEQVSKDSERQIDPKSLTQLPEFPLERVNLHISYRFWNSSLCFQARLSLMPPLVILLAAATAGYGWAVEKHANIAGPLILHIISECQMLFQESKLKHSTSWLFVHGNHERIIYYHA